MASRLELQTKLEDLLGTRNVYFQPPSSVQMKYDAIVYSLSDFENTFANDSVYTQMRGYKVTAICEKSDAEVVTKLSRLPNCSFVTSYTSDRLYHFVFTLYY